jgi:hypothetical protein
MKTRIRRLIVGISIVLLGLTGSLVAATPASAAGLTCGPALLSPNAQSGYVIHSCLGSGRIHYTVNCGWLAGDFSFTYTYYEPGASIRYRYDCGWHGYGWGVTYRVLS